MREDGLVDAYNEHCYGPRLVGRIHIVPRPSVRRAWRSRLRRISTVIVAAATIGTLTVTLPQAAQAAARPHLRPPPNTVHHTRNIGTIRKIPASCGPVPPPSPPSPSINSLAFVAEPSVNEVQVFDEATGALVGTPITVGSQPEGVGYWRPPASSSQDPEVIATNAANHSVTIIDAVTSTVIATVNVPSGSSAWYAAGSPTQHYALVVDALSGKISVINLANNTDAGEITLSGASGNVLKGIAFSASGQYAYVTDPSQHKIFVLDYTGGSAPYYAVDSTYTNASYDFSGIASDLSTTSSNSFLVTDAQSSGYLLKFTVAGTLSAPTQVKHFNSPSKTPGAVTISPGGTNAWVALTGSTSVDDVVVATGSTTSYTVNSSFSGVGDLALSADGSTLMTADTGSATVQETSATSGSATNSTSPDAAVSSIAPALSTPGAWNAYVTAGSNVDVVNTTTQTLTQSIADTNGPIALATSPDGKYVYVVNQTTPSISVIQTSLVGTTTNPIVATFSIPQGSEPNAPIPSAIAVNPQNSTLLVGDSGNGAVDVIDINPADSQYKTVVARIGLFGSGISSSASPQGITVGPQGTYAYVTEASATESTDGVAVLQATASTTTGYSFIADNEALTQGSDTMFAPGQITINPDGETAYVEGFYQSGAPNVVYAFPIGTNGQLSNGTGSPVTIGYNAAGLTLSPEDQSVFATSTTSYEYSSISIPANSVTYNSATDNSGPGAIAVSTDGIYVAVGETAICGHGHDGVGLYDAGSGTELGSPVSLTSPPGSIAFAPQSSPSPVATSELNGSAANPSEPAIGSGINDVIDMGTPGDAPGLTAGLDTATGVYSLTLDSFEIPDLGLRLSQSATYNSSLASTSGLLGYGWQFSYGITAAQNPHDASVNPCAIVLNQETGATATFFPSAHGPYSSCPSSGYVAHGWVQAKIAFSSNCNGTDSCFVVTRGPSTKYFIDTSNGELIKIQEVHGNSVTITWGSHSACAGAKSTDPCQVTGADGARTLTYTYPTAGTGTCPSSASSCVVVTDPKGRTLTYVQNASGQLTSTSMSNGSQTATYTFTYRTGNILASWWDPQNNSTHPGDTAYSTDLTWTSGRVTEVTGPTMTDAGTSMTSTYLPTTTFTYTGFGTGFAGDVGNGTVLIANPDYNQSNSMPGANLTLDTYADYELVSSVRGFGSLGVYGNYSLPPTASEVATPLRDEFNLMPSEEMNALAGAFVGPPVSGQPSEYDSGVTATSFDASGHALMTTDPNGSTVTTQFDSLGEPTVAVDAVGNEPGASSSTVQAHTETYTYNQAGDLLSTSLAPTEDWNSHPSTSNFYLSNGELCASRTPDEVAIYGALTSCSAVHATMYSYDSSGDLIATTDPLGGVRSLAYNSDGVMCASLTPDGYAAGATLTSCPSSAQNYEQIDLMWNVYNQATESATPNNAAGGDLWKYYNLNDQLIAQVGTLGDPSSCNPLTTGTCPYTIYFVYDATGNQVASTTPTLAAGSTGPIATTYFDPDGAVVATVSADGNASSNPSSYEVVHVGNNLGGSVATTLSSNLGSSCSVVSTTSPCPNTTVIAYDALGQSTGTVTSSGGETGASAVATTTAFNPNSTAAAASSPTQSLGLQTLTQTYDANANLLENSTTASSTTTTGATSTYEPDGSTCWTSPTPWTGSGTPSCDNPPTGSGSLTTVYYHDSSGNVVAIAGPGSNPYSTGNATGCNPLTTAGCSFTTYFTYDENDRQLSVTQPIDASGAYPTTTSFLDPSGQVVAVTGPAGDASACNALVTSTCADTVYNNYDAEGRVIGKTYTDSTPSVTITYNNDGTRHQMTDGTGTSTYTYNLLSQVIAATNGAGSTVTYGYSSTDALTCMSYPNAAGDTCSSSGAGTMSPPSGDITYVYDDQGKLSLIVTWTGVTLTYAYDCAGQIAWVSTGASTGTPCTPTSPSPLPIPTTSSAVTTQYGYTNGQLSSMATTTIGGSSNLLSFALLRDGDNNVSSSTPTVGTTAKPADVYHYTDAAGRITSGPITGSTGSTSYAYNASGSISASTNNFSDTSYSESGELCWTAGSGGSSCSVPPSNATTYGYDKSGQQTSANPPVGGANPQSYGWNQASSELVCVNINGSTCSLSSPTTSTTLYSYDGDGLRTSTTFQSQTSQFVWDSQSTELLADGANDYVYGLNSSVPLLQIAASGSSPAVDLLCVDSNGNTRGLVQVSGGTSSYTNTLVNYVDYDAFGNPITASGGSAVPGGLTQASGGYTFSATPFGFGESYNDQTGLNFLIDRYYEPSINQFLSVDPLLDNTHQAYQYASNNPVNVVDPHGDVAFGATGGWVLKPPQVCSFDGDFKCYYGLSFFRYADSSDPYSNPQGSLNGSVMWETQDAPCTGLYSKGQYMGSQGWSSVNERIEQCLIAILRTVPEQHLADVLNAKAGKLPWWQTVLDVVGIYVGFLALLSGEEFAGVAFVATVVGAGISAFDAARCFKDHWGWKMFHACAQTLEFIVLTALSPASKWVFRADEESTLAKVSRAFNLAANVTDYIKTVGQTYEEISKNQGEGGATALPKH